MVRQRFLVSSFGGSNPSAPANELSWFIKEKFGNKKFYVKVLIMQFIFCARFTLLITITQLMLTQVSFADSKKDTIPTADLLATNLKLHAFRHKVLSTNLANINTPGYKAQEVNLPKKEQDILKPQQKKLKLSVTSVKHFRGNNKHDSDFGSEELKDPDEVKMNGNNVSLSQQMTKLSENQINYDTSLQAYKSSAGLITAVIGK